MMTKEGPTNPLGKRSCAWVYIKCLISIKNLLLYSQI